MAGGEESTASYRTEALSPTLLNTLADLCITAGKATGSGEVDGHVQALGVVPAAKDRLAYAMVAHVACIHGVSAEYGRVNADTRKLTIVEGTYLANRKPLRGVRAEYYFEWTERNVELAYKEVYFMLEGRNKVPDLGDPLQTCDLEDAVEIEGVANYDIRYLISLVRTYVQK